MNTKNVTNSQIMLVALDTIIVFLLGVLGNQINISIPPLILFSTIGILITLLIIVHIKINMATNSNLISTGFFRVLPRTMAGIFSVGIIIGLIAGSLLHSANLFSISFTAPGSAVPSWELVVNRTGILTGFAICVLIAFKDRHLAIAFLLGYAIALPISISFFRPARDDLLIPLLINVLCAFPIGAFLLMLPSTFTKLVKAIFQPRI